MTSSAPEGPAGQGGSDSEALSREPPSGGWRIEGLQQQLAPAGLALVAVVAIASSEGGYFPTTWGWSALALLGVIATWTLANGRTDCGRFDAAFLIILLLFTGWTGLSIIWSIDRGQSVLEFERAAVPLVGCAAFLLLARKASLRAATLALIVAVTAVSSYALATRLIPDHFGAYDPVATYRLSQPVGYWNGLGVFVVIGILLALGVATDRSSRLAPRAIAAAALVLLPVTLFFTYSRGSWIALGVGAAIAVIASPRRLHLVAVAPWFAVLPAVGIAVAAHSKALTHQNALPRAIEQQGHRLYLMLLALMALGALSTMVLVRLERRIRLAPRGSRVLGAVLVTAAACGLVAVVVRAGGPIAFVDRGYDSFSAAAPSTEKTDLNARLLSLNGNGRAQLWRVALNAADAHWLAGTGAGSFARQWQHSPTANFSVRDAHGLYIETISELGVIGLLLLVGALMVPAVAGVAARREAAVPAVLGAYGAFVFHNGIDWDWELSGVALSGLLVGSLLLLTRREGTERQVGAPARTVALVAVAAAGALALVGAIGNGALARAQTANGHGRYAAAESEATVARHWLPWSTAPLLALGEAQIGRGDVSGAVGSFRKAISIDRRDWQAWLDLAAVTHGAARKHAVGVARSLYPTSPEIVEFLNQEAEQAAALDKGPSSTGLSARLPGQRTG